MPDQTIFADRNGNVSDGEDDDDNSYHPNDGESDDERNEEEFQYDDCHQNQNETRTEQD